MDALLCGPCTHKTPSGACLLLSRLLTPVVADVIPLVWIAGIMGFENSFPRLLPT
jgi:hypothetical protein